MKKASTPTKPKEFITGPRIDEKLVNTLNKSSANTLIQLPVLVDCGPLGIKHSSLQNGDVNIPISLDTGALSMTLPMLLRPLCSSFPCRVWLEGTWGSLIPYEPPETLPVFAVHRVVGLADENESYIRVTKIPSENWDT